MELLNRRYDDACPIENLKPHPRNPRQGDIGAIYSSIEANGFFGAVVAQLTTRHILAGNHRFQAAAHAGASSVPVIWVDCDDEAALKIMLADNRTSDLSSYDVTALAELVDNVRSNSGLEGTGWDDEALQNLCNDLSGLALGDLSGSPKATIAAPAPTARPAVAPQAVDTDSEDEDEDARVDDSDVVRPQVFTSPDAPVQTPVESTTPAPGEIKSPTALSLVNVTIDDPKTNVTRGDVWSIGKHVLVCSSVIDGWPAWAPHLQPGSLFCPFPGPFILLSDKALDEQRLVLVQPDTYIAGHIVDRYKEVFGDSDITVKSAQ